MVNNKNTSEKKQIINRQKNQTKYNIKLRLESYINWRGQILTGIVITQINITNKVGNCNIVVYVTVTTSFFTINYMIELIGGGSTLLKSHDRLWFYVSCYNHCYMDSNIPLKGKIRQESMSR